MYRRIAKTGSLSNTLAQCRKYPWSAVWSWSFRLELWSELCIDTTVSSPKVQQPNTGETVWRIGGGETSLYDSDQRVFFVDLLPVSVLVLVRINLLC